MHQRQKASFCGSPICREERSICSVSANEASNLDIGSIHHLNSHYFLLDLQALDFAERSTSVVFALSMADRERVGRIWNYVSFDLHIEKS